MTEAQTALRFDNAVRGVLDNAVRWLSVLIVNHDDGTTPSTDGTFGGLTRQTRLVDVANHAGVSMKTVSRVLNNEPYVKDAMRRRVMASVDTLGYVGDAQARGLRLKHSGFIGLIIPDIRNGFFALLTRALEERLSPTSPTMLFGDSAGVIDQEERYLRAFRQQRVDGLVILPSGAPSLAETIAQVPTVVLERTVPAIKGLADHVLANDRKAAETLVGHMVHHHGLTQVCLVVGDPSISSMRDRQSGYNRVVKQAGLSRLVTTGHTTPDDAAAGAYALFKTLDPPFGVLTTNNRMFWGALAAIARLGLSIPKDVVLTTFDSIGEATVTGLVPTQAVIPVSTVAARAMQLLTERILDPTRPAHTVVVDCDIEYGTTCGCVPLTTSPILAGPMRRR